MRLFEDERDNKNAADILMGALLEFSPVPKYERSRFISPSGLNCQVACAFKMTGAPADAGKESFQSKSFAENGSDRHTRIQNFLKTTPYWVDVVEYVKEYAPDLEIIEEEENEVLLYSKKFNLRFKCDGILFINGTFYVLEIKTERQAANDTRISADDKHIKQGIAYALVLGIDAILWLYEGRNFLTPKVFLQHIVQEEKEALSAYITDIIEHAEQPENLGKDTRSCRTCAYSRHCKKYFKELAVMEVLNATE